MSHAAADDSLDLRRYLRDLVALSTLPAVWVGEPRQAIVDSLADALVGTLQVEFVYARLEASGSDDAVETGRRRGASIVSIPFNAHAVGQTLLPWLRPLEHVRHPSVPNPLREGDVQLAIAPIGRAGGLLGVIAAGVERADFPSRYDLLLINVVANQAATAIQSAQLRRVQSELAAQRRTEEVLRRSEERFRALIEHSSDIITLHRRDRTMTYVSPSTRRILGYEPADMLGQSSADSVHPADRLRVARIWSDLVARPGAVITFRYRLKHADGTWRWMEAIGTNLLGEPAVGAVVVNRRDITSEIDAHQLLEDRVAERTRQLESLFRADETLYSALRMDDVIRALVDTAREVLGVDHASVSVAPHLDQSDIDGARVRMRVPIVARGEVFATFDVGYDNHHEFSEEERRLCTALARRAGLAMENARLFEAARGVAALEERQKLARELHDSVSQALYAISLNAAAANEVLEQDPSHAQGLMVDLLSLAEAGMAEMRALIFELRPESLETEGLTSALEKQVAALRARHHLDVSTVLSAEPQLPLPIKEALYRIAQEALHNIARHAHARHVDVALDGQRAGEVVLRIADDGRGFDTMATFPGHLGLHSMRERAAAIGADLEVQSAPSQGTRMVVRVPLTLPPDGHLAR